MTAFTPSQIPATVDTLEKLSVWLGMALHQINESQTAIEGEGASRVSQFGVFFVENNNTYRAITRISVEVDKNYGTVGKIWMAAKNLSLDSFPYGFTA